MRRRRCRKLGWRGACALRTPRQKSVVTLYWFQDYRGSLLWYTTLADGRRDGGLGGGGLRGRRDESGGKGGARARARARSVADRLTAGLNEEILYPRVRNCHTLRDVCRDFHLRGERQCGQFGPVSVRGSLPTRDARLQSDWLFFATSITGRRRPASRTTSHDLLTRDGDEIKISQRSRPNVSLGIRKNSPGRDVRSEALRFITLACAWVRVVAWDQGFYEVRSASLHQMCIQRVPKFQNSLPKCEDAYRNIILQRRKAITHFIAFK